ncbi:sensor histidine kinase [Ureibacillus acetophenoni]|uniref:histidine kinase n=1 Tax=Ureibacillus acetophenoni TaxID=614649 RepID=A0A285UBE6_9BACL|nr:sensor histidine kinase [Ureibacillus acetophenoni]SOC39152.1 signal transduction histidine kinase [Ureibacillus acetophenoni]
MLFLYIRERWAWIVFFILLLLIMNVLFYLDIGLSGISIGYFNLIVIFLFLSFFGWRYFKETAQFKNFLGNVFENNNLSDLNAENLSPYQRKYMEHFIRILEKKEALLNETKIRVLEDTEDVLAWVHEMKTPLTAMKLMVEQVEDLKIQQKIEKEWVRINYLLDQQLHNTRLATIEKDNRFEIVELKSVVYKEIKDFQSWCMEKGLGFQIDGLEQEVITDRKWLSFIIRQVLSNAIKYSYENTEIHLFTEIDDKEHLLLHIQDHGIGIPVEDISRIFQKSFTGTVGRESFQSTGMGLFLANDAAKKLGIKIIVESKVNEGSIFTLQFPNKNEYQEILGR